jgi:protein TonB
VVPVQVNPNAAPVEAPKEIKPEVSVPSVGEGVPGGVEGGVPGGVVGGVVGGLPSAPPPPPPPPQAPIRVGGAIKQPNKIKNVNPVYPPIAQSARVSGVVIIEATIGPDGHVKDAKVLRSIPLLDQAALDAVKQWQFTPTLLNGVPVPVIMTVTVNFTLQ